MPGTATVELPRAERSRDRAARRGGHRRHRRVARRTPSDRDRRCSPSTSTRVLAKMVIEDAGVDPGCGQRPVTPRRRRVGHVRAGHPVANTWACRWISASASTSAARPSAGHGVAGRGGHRTRASATRCWPWCPGRRRCRGPSSGPAARPNWYGASSEQLRLAAGRVRDPVRQRRAERARTRRSPSATRPSSATTSAAMAKIAVDQRTNACATPARCSTASRSPSTTCWPAR